LKFLQREISKGEKTNNTTSQPARDLSFLLLPPSILPPLFPFPFEGGGGGGGEQPCYQPVRDSFFLFLFFFFFFFFFFSFLLFRAGASYSVQ